MKTPSFQEDPISQIPALQLLQKLGYVYLSPEQAVQARGGKTTNVLLEDILRKQLKEINSIRVSSAKTSLFSDANIEAGIQALKDVPMQDGYIAACEYAYNLITLGKALEQSIDGDKKSFTLQYIDWQNIHNNVFHISEEYSVMRSNSKDHYRPDIVLFVNGIPLSIIECKSPKIKDPLIQAISQHIRNQQDDGIRKLYVYSQLLLSLATVQASYATTDTKEEFWAQWREQSFNREEEIKTKELLTQLINTPLTNEQKKNLYNDRPKWQVNLFEEREAAPQMVSLQDQYIYYLCRPERLLELTRDFILYEGIVKKITRYQQYFAIKKITERIQVMESGKRKGGVIWHTQGSGKSLTMAMLAKAIAQTIKNPKIVLVTDRVDLDQQITSTFKRVDIPVHNAATGQRLTELLQSKSDAVITTIINKFEAAVNKLQTPLDSPNIFVLIDEGHRTQYGTFNVKMQKVLPNACFLAFTGTPLMKKEKSTASKFGGIIDAYAVMQAVEDGAVVPIVYEGRHAIQEVNQQAIDRYFDMVSEPLGDYEKKDLKKKFSRADQISKTEQRIQAIAMDISIHFTNNWGVDRTGERSGFKGMVVCPDKLTAVKYKEAFDLLGKVSTEVVMSPPDDREGNEDTYGEPSDKVLAYWKKMLDAHGKRYEQNIINQFKNADHPELLIVVDKLLTGFDEPKVIVMYVCRKLRDHTLLQAIARVNRVAKGKDRGFIIDYEGIIEELDVAMNTYTNTSDFENEDLAGTFTNINKEITKLPQLHSELKDIFKTLPNKLDATAQADLLKDLAIRTEFYQKLGEYARSLKMALSSIDFETNTPEKVKLQYKVDLKHFVELRNTVVGLYSDKVDFKRYEKQLQKLLDQHVSTQEVIRLTELVSIMDKEAFERELEKITGTAAKAETIASRTSKHITEKMDEDPAFYKKLSELIQQTIADYRAKRISELEFLKRVKEFRDQAVNRTGDEIPALLQSHEVAQAFYRQLNDAWQEKFKDKEINEEVVAQSALEVDKIIKSLVVVDWQEKSNIQKKMIHLIGDYFIDEVRDKYDVKMSFEEIDAIAEAFVDVAKKRYKQ